MKERPPYHRCFETLSSDLRLKILRELERGPQSVSDLADSLGVEQSRLSHSLSMLRTCHYVDVKTEGKKRIYSLDGRTRSSGPVSDVWKAIDRHHRVCCNSICRKMNKSA